MIRAATIEDIPQLQRIESEYYEGFSCPPDILRAWIAGAPGNFLVTLDQSVISAFIFFEYIAGAEALPFIHKLAHYPGGKVAYVSEVGAARNQGDVLQGLVEAMLAKSKEDGCEKVAWLTGSKRSHDQIETQLLIRNGFVKRNQVQDWEAYPDFFVSDHWLWERLLRI